MFLSELSNENIVLNIGRQITYAWPLLLKPFGTTYAVDFCSVSNGDNDH